MTTNLRDPRMLIAVSPMALSAYAQSVGWSRAEAFGDNSDVYANSLLPEIIIPRTSRLGDYAQVVARLISIFAQAAELEEIELYNNLVVSDRDVTRVAVNDGTDDGTIDLEQGSNLVVGSREMYLAAACSLNRQSPVYRAGAHQEANECLRRIRIGQTERGSYVVTLLSPAIPPQLQAPLMPDSEIDDDPMDRRISLRLAHALSSVRDATSRAISGDTTAFTAAVPEGTSANLCEALVQMLEPFSHLEVSMTWAKTRPLHRQKDTVRFSSEETSILREAARSFRSREPRLDFELFGSVQRLKRDDSETDGTVTLRASIDGRTQSVTAVLSESDYNRAIEAHRERAPIKMEGDLDRFGQRWRLVNPRITEVLMDEEDENQVEEAKVRLDGQ